MTVPNGPNPPNPPNPPNQPNSGHTDPTALTTEQLLREINNLTTIFDAKMDVLKEEVEGGWTVRDVRFEAIAHEFANVKEQFRSEFGNVKDRFDLNEKQRVEQKADTEKAVQAALLAQKEAVKEQTAASQLSIAKSETGVKEQSNQQYQTITAELRAITDKIGVLTARVGTIEASKIGATETRSTQQSSIGSAVGIIGAALGVVMFVVTIGALLFAK